MSTYDLLGWPTEVSVIVVSVAFALALVPWLAGLEVGPIKVPALDAAATKRLRTWGWMLPLVPLALYLQVWPKTDDKSFDVDVRFQSGSTTPLECGRLTQASAVLTLTGQPAQPPFHAPIDGRCTATFSGIPTAHRNRQAALTLENTTAYVLRDSGPQYLVPGQTLIATMDDTQVVPRLRVAVLPSRVDAAAPQLQQFQEALQDKIVNVSQTFAGRGDAYSYLTQLKLWTEGPLMPSMQEMSDFWKARHALELVRGEIDQTTQPVTVHSEVFLGDLAPSPQRTAVHFDVTITPDNFSQARDSYSVVTLYALARDAQRLKRPPDIVAALLSEARAQVQQIDNPSHDLTDIRAAIETELQSLRGATP